MSTSAAANSATPAGVAPSGTPAALESGLRRVDHVGIAVPDMDSAITFYTNILGMRLLHQEINTEQGVREAMLGFDDAGGSATISATAIQLLAPLHEDSPIAQFLDSRGPGIHQLAYTVDNIVEASAKLKAKGLRLLYATPHRGTGGSLINFVHPRDAGGVLIELVELIK